MNSELKLDAEDECPTGADEADGDEERELCLVCLEPNEPGTNFCWNCRAPLSSYAAIGPFESIFAEGFIYRAAVERPSRLIVVIGLWVLFGVPNELFGSALIWDHGDLKWTTWSFAIFFVAGLIIPIRSTLNYLAFRNNPPQTEPEVG